MSEKMWGESENEAKQNLNKRYFLPKIRRDIQKAKRTAVCQWLVYANATPAHITSEEVADFLLLLLIDDPNRLWYSGCLEVIFISVHWDIYTLISQKNAPVSNREKDSRWMSEMVHWYVVHNVFIFLLTMLFVWGFRVRIMTMVPVTWVGTTVMIRFISGKM